MDANLTIPANVTVRPATPDEVAKLKKDWEHDPCYDLHDFGAPPQHEVDDLAADGGGELIDWSAHTQDLSEHQNVQEAEWQLARRQREEAERKQLGLSQADYRQYLKAKNTEQCHTEQAKKLMHHFFERTMGPLNADDYAELDELTDSLISAGANRAAMSRLTGKLP